MSTPAVAAPSTTATTLEVENLQDAGAGSLRAAIEEADSTDGDDVITFRPGLSGAIRLTSGAIVLGSGFSLTIEGPGASQLAVVGDRVHTIFTVVGNGAISVSGLTVTGAAEGGAFDGAQSGGLGSFYGDFDLSRVNVSGNTSNQSQAAALSLNAGLDVTIVDSVFTDNVGEARYSRGGALSFLNVRNLRIVNTTVSRNVATSGGGGGMWLTYPHGDVSIVNTTFAGNAAGGGGGVDLDRCHTSISFVDSTISGNTAVDGAGVYTSGCDEPVSFVDTTISGNRASGRGGGVFEDGVQANSAFTDTTIADNRAADTGGVFAYSGSTLFRGSIVADNTHGDLGLGAPPNHPSNPGDAFDLDFSLIENPGPVPLVEVTAGSNLLDVDPDLGPLADNGGATRTQLPARGSAVVDRGRDYGMEHDQRGLTRPVDFLATPNSTAPGEDASDMGSVEVQPRSTSTTLAATVHGRSVSLQARVVGAGDAPSPAGAVTFFDGADTIATVTLTDGRAAARATDLTEGDHSLRAVFAPEHTSDCSPSASDASTVVIYRFTSTTTVRAQIDHQTVRLLATVAGAPGEPTPTGAVSFFDGSTPIGVVPVTGGVAERRLRGVAPGKHVYLAEYAPSDQSGFPPSSSAARSQVSRCASTVHLEGPRRVSLGQRYHLEVVVSSACSLPARGRVTISENGRRVVRALLRNERVHLLLPSDMRQGRRTPGQLRLRSSYSGSDSVLPSSAQRTIAVAGARRQRGA